MNIAEINGKVATSAKGNLVVTGIVANKRGNIFVGTAFKEGEIVSGMAYVEPNAKFVPNPKYPDQLGYNLVMFLSKEAEEIKLIQQKVAASVEWAKKATTEAGF